MSVEQARFEDLAAAIGLKFWGSDCSACEGETTFGSMQCESCGSTRHTVALWIGPASPS